MKIQITSTDGKEIIKESELDIQSGDRVIATVSPINGIPPTLKQIDAVHNKIKTALIDNSCLITLPSFIQLSVLRVGR